MKRLILSISTALAISAPVVGHAALIGLSSTTDSIYRIDETTGAATLIAKTDRNASLSGLSFLDGNLYGTDLLGDPLRTGVIDTTTGAVTGVSDQDGSVNWHGLASDEEAGLLYSIDIRDGKLKSLTADGTVTTIGSTSGSGMPLGISGSGMAYDDANDILYATNGSGGLYTVSTVTGASTLIGDTGIGSLVSAGLAYDEDADTLFAMVGSSGFSTLYSLDIVTGGPATLIGSDRGVADIDGLAWVSEVSGVPPVPVPSSLPLLLGGAGLLAALRRRKG